MEEHVVDTLARERRGLPHPGPVVIRPRPMTLETWEELARRHPELGKRVAAHPMHLSAVARTILRHDEAARERFGDEESLVRHLSARLPR